MKTKIILSAFLLLVVALSSFSLLRIRVSQEPGVINSVSNPEVKQATFITGNWSNADDRVYYTCGECGCAEDDSFFVKPGLCASCGMELVATYKNMKKSSGKESSPTDGKKVAILVFDGVQTIDYSGPVEVFSEAGMETFTVSQRTEPVRTAAGIRIVPDYTFDNCPGADIIVLPGGNVDENRKRPEVQAWVKKNAILSERVLSVCNGAFYLASTGLLDHQKATTFNGLIPKLEKEVPTATIVRDERFTDNGKIITAAGLASGIDGALHVVEEYLGRARTRELATNMEYNWDPDGGFVRAALADNHLCSGMSVLYQFDNKILAYQGDRNQWLAKYLVKSDLSKEKLKGLVQAQWEQSNHWTKTSGTTNETIWKFKSDDGEDWTAWVAIDGKPNAWNVSMNVKKENDLSGKAGG